MAPTQSYAHHGKQSQLNEGAVWTGHTKKKEESGRERIEVGGEADEFPNRVLIVVD